MGAIENELIELSDKIADIGREFKFLKERFTDNSCILVAKGVFWLNP